MMLRAISAVQTVEVARPAEVHDLQSIRSIRHDDLVARARDELVRGDEDAALAACTRSLRYGRSYEALALAGTIEAMTGHLEESVRFTKEAIEVAPKRPDAYYDLGATLIEMGRAAEALDWIERGVELLGDRTDDLVDFLLSARVETLTRLDRIEEAEAALENARARTDDPLNLLESAEEMLEARQVTPRLRVIDCEALA